MSAAFLFAPQLNESPSRVAATRLHGDARASQSRLPIRDKELQ
jgi:hypothetical protein